jgi:hypothetical protein
MDPVTDPLLLRKSGSTGNRTRTFWICSQIEVDKQINVDVCLIVGIKEG